MRKYSNQKGIVKSINIPDELMQFVKKDTYSLIIKGSAGTGKTTLSLTILKALDIKDNFFYICTRVSPKQLLLSYPWIAKFKETQKERGPVPEIGEMDVPLNFEDARLDEPESLFERITNELMDVKAPLIIIDSWDAVASFMDREARLNNERVLQTWRERAGAKIIFVNEDPNDTSLDFVVDGAVKLDQTVYEDVRIREISLLKLRGIKISKHSYTFTLNNSEFRSFQTYNPRNFATNPDIMTPLPLDKKKNNVLSLLREHGSIKTGYKDLDTNLGGGFPRRGIVILEVDSKINVAVPMAFLLKIVVTFLNFDSVVFFEPPVSVDAPSTVFYLKTYQSLLQTGSHKFFWLGPQVQGRAEPSSTEPNKNHDDFLLEHIYDNASKERQTDPDSPILNIMPIGRVQTLDSSAKKEHLRFTKQNIDLTIFVARKNESSQWAMEVCDIFLKIIVVKGSLFLRTLYPLSPVLAMEVKNSSGYPIAKLLPLV
jgi:KaiC/GvpD/RAD55 family RecA-like ATPase